MANGDIISCDKFPQFFVDQTPHFDEMIMYDIRPTDGWLGNVKTGSTPMGTPTEITQDRFKHVFPNVTKQWERVNVSSCFNRPCDPNEHTIGWGAERRTYFAEQQAWQTPLLCYDQDMHVTHAEQHIEQLITDILRPATTTISSYFLRKRHLQWADKRWVANRNMGTFTYQWTVVGDEEIFFDCSVAPTNVFKLAPQMLQYQWEPLMAQGYGGKNPFSDTAPFVELVTDIDTCWELDKLGGQTGVGVANNPSVSANWRFEQWGAANKYWRYGFSGQLGNFLVRTDMQGLRFNFILDLGAGAAPNRYRYQFIMPYRNVVTSGAGSSPGLGSQYNEDFKKAQFAISQIHHKSGMELLVPDARPLNPEVPFGHRDFGGRWRFAMHDLGTDVNGCVIANKWENKGQFISMFKYYIRPLHTEFLQAIFHKREPMCVPEINTCSPSPGYPTQTYTSENDTCPATAVVLTFTPVRKSSTGTYEILANTVLCNGDNVDNGAITGSATLAALVVLLEADAALGALGTWAVSGSNITLTGDVCNNAILPFEA